MAGKHITRDYSAHKKSVIRPYDEFCKIEIFSFDPKYTQTYLTENDTLKKGDNAKKTDWKSWACFKSDLEESKNKDNDMEFTVSYNVKEAGDYRIDFLYEQNNKIFNDSNYDTGADLTGHVLIEKDERTVYDADVLFDGENNVIKRKAIFMEDSKSLNKGTHTITISVPRNCYFMGIIVRKQILFYGNNYFGADYGKDEGNLMLRSATVTISDMTKPSELVAEIGYDDAFECFDSPSGFYMDYMDEVNFYVKDNDNQIERVFGGYISSILPDSNRTKLSINCADRLIDGQNKYVLDLMKIQGGTVKADEDEYSEGMTKYFNSYAHALKYLCDYHEMTLKSNISKNYLVDGEKFSKGLSLTYGKKKSIKKITVSNATATPSDNYILLRNKPSAEKKQVWTLYNASKTAKQPPNITNAPYMHITYGLGGTKTEHKQEVTEKVDVADTVAGSQKFTKCGVSQDKKYVMGIGQYSSAKGHSGLNYQTIYKTVFKNECPHCKKNTLRWDSCRSDTKCIFTGNWNGTKGSWGGGIPETEITCTHCDSDYDAVTGYEKDAPWKKLKKVSQTVKSSKAEQTKLHKGEMVAVPSTSAEITPDDIFKAITKIAFKYKYKLRGDTSQTYNDMKKTGHGDCWAFSDLIFTELSKYGVTCKIVDYVTGASDHHRSVRYKNASGKWVDFPYREYGWGTKYNNMLNNTSASKNAHYIKLNKGSNIGNIKTSSKSTTKSQKTTITTTKGYDKDKPFQAYFKITYSNEPSFKAKKQTVYIKFTQTAPTNKSINTATFPLYWINNTSKKSTLSKNNKAFDLVGYIRQIHRSNESVYLQSIQLIAPVIKETKDNKETDWYKVDKQTVDESSCKMNLYQITFNDNQESNPSELDSCGKTVNELIKQLVEDSGYLVDMSYGKHRIDDIINFRVDNSSTASFVAGEGDNNNILSWNSINYSPVGSYFNMSMQVFKDNSGNYKYIDSRSPTEILKYQEQCTLQTSNEVIGEEEAYYNARMSDKFTMEQLYTYTITVPNYPDLRLGELVQVIANAKKLSNIKELQSIKITFDMSKIPRIQTELGLGELSPQLQLQQNIRKLRQDAKKQTTYFDGSAVPVTNTSIYQFDR